MVQHGGSHLFDKLGIPEPKGISDGAMEPCVPRELLQ